jgi:hypothetical protein
MNGTEVLLKMERQMLDSRIFDRVQRKWEAADGKGTVKFQMSATVARATQRPNYPVEQDFGKKSLAERRFGPEKPEETEASSEASAPPDPASLPSEPKLADAGADAAEVSGTERAATTTAPAGKRPAAESSKPSSKPVKSERKSGSGAIVSPEEVPDEAAEGDGAAGKSARPNRRPGSTGGGGSDLARRSERNPGSSDAEFKAPEPLSDAAIAAMTLEEVKTMLSKVSIARLGLAPDDPEQPRLRIEFDKLISRTRPQKGGGS